jgi:dolichyl-phosphate-mannose-protein mannosyltransferase
MARTRGKSPQPPVKAPTPVTEKQQPFAAPPPQPQTTAVTTKSKPKNKNTKNTSYKSDGVEDNDVFLLPVSDYWVALALILVATIVRVYKIYQPTSVVFDEVQCVPPAS